MKQMTHSKIDLRVVELEEEGGIYCPFVCDGSVKCAHVQQNYDVMKINYMCQCNRDRPAPQDTKLPERMNIVELCRDCTSCKWFSLGCQEPPCRACLDGYDDYYELSVKQSKCD